MTAAEKSSVFSMTLLWLIKENATQQANWLERVLAAEHEQERTHPDRIQLPE